MKKISKHNLLLSIVMSTLMQMSANVFALDFLIKATPDLQNSGILNINVQPDATMIGQPGSLFIASQLPNGSWLYPTLSGWRSWNPNTPLPPYLTTMLQASNNFIFPNNMYTSATATLYAGYGANMASMVKNGTYTPIVTPTIATSTLSMAVGTASICGILQTNNVQTFVFNSYAQFDTASGSIKGLSNDFCVFTNNSAIAMIDLQTLESKQPSIAATYLLKGLNVAALPKPGPGDNPGTVYCKALEATSITRYTSGGFISPGGEDEVCVFADGSMISIWALVYVSSDPNYLSMRASIQSQPLNLPLPYILP